MLVTVVIVRNQCYLILAFSNIASGTGGLFMWSMVQNVTSGEVVVAPAVCVWINPWSVL